MKSQNIVNRGLWFMTSYGYLQQDCGGFMTLSCRKQVYDCHKLNPDMLY